MKTYSVTLGYNVTYNWYDDIKANSLEEAIDTCRKTAEESSDWDQDDDCGPVYVVKVSEIAGDDGETLFEQNIPLREQEAGVLLSERRLRYIENGPMVLEALEKIAKACRSGIDRSDDELEAFIASVRTIALDAIAKLKGNAA